MEQTENKPAKEKKKEPVFMKQYRQCYPASKIFYVASDNLVFLENQEQQAAAHQKSIGKGELTTYN